MSAPTEAERETEATALYRFYDSSGSLLYVGITGNMATRLMQHDRAQPWWRLVASSTVEHYDNRQTALAAEAVAIEGERPQFNRYLVRGKMVMRSFYVPLDRWEDAKTLADERDQNISDVVRELLEGYVKKKGGKR